MKGQSHKHSIAEAWTNIFIGFSINYCANLVILPIFGFHITLANNFYLGCMYTGVSLTRQYVLRRWFNKLMIAAHIKEGEKMKLRDPRCIRCLTIHDGPCPDLREDKGIGDVNSDARGSGARYNTGKPDLSLIPLDTLADEARVWMYGEKKYTRGNWMKGMPWSVPYACALRHLGAWQRGENLDPESGLPHLAHVMCNLRMLTYYAAHYPEGDDRFILPEPSEG